MARSVQQTRGGPFWPLGFVAVANNGTQVCIATNIDANNLNSPNTPNPPNGIFPSTKTEYTPAFRGLGFQGYKPGNNNNGMIPNSGNVYILVGPAGGNGNRADSGAMIKVLGPGQDFFYPPPGTALDMVSPYFLYLDADVDGEGALVVGYGGGNP